MDTKNTFYCPSCNAGFEYSPELGGEKCQCCYCEHKFIVPMLHRVDKPQKEKRVAKKQSPQVKRRPPIKNYSKRKNPIGAIIGVLTVAVCVVIAVIYYMHTREKPQKRTAFLILNEGGDSSDEHSESVFGVPKQKRERSIKPKVILQPAKPSGIYSGFDIKGIESIVDDVEKGDDFWRKEAEKRIDKYRKTDIKVKVVDALSGKPVKDAEVTLKLVQHDFRFGGIINAGEFRRDEEKYKKVFLAMGFNSSGFNNALKYKLWRGGQKKNPEEIIEWLHSNDISVRGHCLIWPGMSQGSSHMPKELMQLIEQYQKSKSKLLEQQIRECSHDVIKKWAEKWDVCDWDVINETRGNHVIQDLLGKEIEADWFKTAKKYARNPDAKLYLNENKVISDPGRKQRIVTQVGKKRVVTFEYKNEVRSDNIMKYHANVKELLKNGAPINALGFQSRFKKDLSPEMIYERLCVFDEFGLPITATEFEMTPMVGEELDKAKLTERVMTIYFSHKLVDGIYAWTLFPSSFADAEGNEIINADGTPNLRGKVWLYLTKNRWNTHVTVATDDQGTATIRGFKGKYKITVKADGKEKSAEAEFNKSEGAITIKI